MRHPEGDKLDRLMVILLSYIHDVCHDSTGVALDWPATKSLYRDLIQIFDSTLLPARASGHAQFALFYLCGFRATLAKSFLAHLWKKAIDRNLAGMTRQAAAVYLSGFLARANYLQVDGVVIDYLEKMADWTRGYVDEASANKPMKPVDATHHGAFYSVCESLFYIFVFRHRAIQALEDGQRRLKSLGLSALVNCRLNPLRWCHRTVAETFAAASLAAQTAFCYTILDRNRRCLPPLDLPPGRSANNPLDLYFPFDHYLLRRSERFVAAMYCEYDGPVPKDYCEERDAAMDEGQNMTSRTGGRG
jgi:RNA polymerase I-specific transcription initiation factor RRN3